MSRGQSHPRTQFVKRTIGRCPNKSNVNFIFDVDKGKIDVVIVDTPESSHQGSRCSRARTKQNEKCSYSGVIRIDDEGYDDDAVSRSADHDASSSRTFRATFSNSHVSEGSDSDECVMVSGKGKFSSEFQDTNMFTKYGSSRNTFGLSDDSECSTSETESDSSESGMLESSVSDSESSDCEIIDDSSGIREEWERAALKKKMTSKHFGSKENETSKEKVGLDNTIDSAYSVETRSEPVHSNVHMSSKGKDDPLSGTSNVDGFKQDTPINFKGNCSVGADHGIGQATPVRCGSDDKDEQISESHRLHRTRSQDNALSDPDISNCCDQDVPVAKCFSCNTQMQHDTHARNDRVRFMHKEDVNGRTLCFDEVHEKPLNEEMLNFGKPSPRKNQPSDVTQTVTKTTSLQDKNGEFPLQTVYDVQTKNGAEVTREKTSFQGKTTSLGRDMCNIESLDEASCKMGIYHSLGEEETVPQAPLGNILEGDAICGKSTGNMSVISEVVNDIICGREKHKETDEYRRAAEEEWVSRQRELQIQAEEAQRLRKRKKAETLRLLDMEKRQKQRVEEIRESQKRDEETINLKEQLRVEVMKDLAKLEMRHRDMASLLRGLGIPVSGGPFALSCDVNAAYKQALLRFHPDRASRTDMRKQVEAEEKFKLISRLKEKLQPVAQVNHSMF